MDSTTEHGRDGRADTSEDTTAPLNLRVQRTPRTRTMPAGRVQGALALAVPAGMLLAAVARKRVAGGTVAAIVASGVVLLAGRRLLRRRAAARDASLDAQIAQSFPASDSSAHW